MAEAAKQIDCQFTSEVVCPHCGHEHSDSWEITSDTYECHECGKGFGIERNHDTTYCTFIPKPKKVEVAPKPDLSFMKHEPPVVQRVGEIRIHETTLGVWEENVEPSMQKVLLGVLGWVHRRGFAVERDPRVLELYPTIANDHWYAKRGELEAQINLTGRHLEVVLFQSVHNIDHPSGGRYQSDKLKCMPRPMQILCIAEMIALTRHLLRYGYTLSDYNGLARPIPLSLAVARAVDGTWHIGESALEHFNRRWQRNRFKRDEDGFMSEEETSAYGGRLDRDGVPLHKGETRYFYRSGRLMRGTVYPDANTSWLVAFGGELGNIQTSELFICDPTTVPRRFVPGQVERLHREAERALKAKNYKRAYEVARALLRASVKEGTK